MTRAYAAGYDRGALSANPISKSIASITFTKPGVAEVIPVSIRRTRKFDRVAEAKTTHGLDHVIPRRFRPR